VNGSYTGLGILLRGTTSLTDASQSADVLYHSLTGPIWLGVQPTQR